MGVADYVVGQCTWFVSHSLTWLGVGKVGALGDAQYWLSNAKAKGLSVGSVPVVGAAAVFAPGKGGAGPNGHVGVVEQVNPNGTFVVASDNWGGLGIHHIATQSMADVQGFILPPNSSAGQAGAINAFKMVSTPDPGYNAMGKNFNANPFDPASGFNIGNDLAKAPGNVADAAAKPFADLALTIAGWIARSSLIFFGMVLVVIGIIILFKGSADTDDIQSPVGNIIGSSGTPDTQQQTGTTTIVERGPRGGKRGSTTKTFTRTKKGKARSGIKGKLSKVGKVAEDA